MINENWNKKFILYLVIYIYLKDNLHLLLIVHLFTTIINLFILHILKIEDYLHLLSIKIEDYLNLLERIN